MIPPLLALLACQPGKTGAPDSDPVWVDDSGSGDGGDDGGGDSGGGSGGGSGGEVPVERVPGAVDDNTGCGPLYDPEVVQDYAIEISTSEWNALLADYASGQKDYHPVTFTHGDAVVDDAMIRLKGNPSFSWFTEKMQFVIAFNEVNPDGRYQGLRKIALDASWYEPTLLRDRVTWSIVARQGGLPHPCAASATLTVNGEYYGLYTSIEFLDHEWLERSFGDEGATGTLWKYGYDAVSNADASTGVVDEFNATTDPDTLATLGDPAQWLLEWAAEVVVGDDDGYWCCDHNYYLYEHPTDGLMFVPWDMDDNFDVQAYDVDPITGYDNWYGLFQQPHFLALVRDETWGPVFLDQLEQMNEAMDPDLVDADITAWDAQISELYETDPNRSVGWEEHQGAVARFQDWVPARHAFLKSWIACQRGERTDADGDGAPVCTDPNDGDATVYPGATETCDGLDNDADGRTDEGAGCDDCERHDVDDSRWLFCRDERTAAEASARCAEEGGELDAPSSTAEYYLVYFYAWPALDTWWAGEPGGRGCPTYVSSSWGMGSADCATELPSLCKLP